MGTERRKNRRLPVSLDVVLNHRAQSIVCTMRNISLDGAFIDADSDLLPYAGVVEMGFSLPPPSNSDFVRVVATIERTTQDGTAVTFGDVGREAYFRLVDLVTNDARAAPSV